MKSKQDEVLALFFNEPTRQWHFTQIKELVALPDNKISRWLKIFQKQGLIRKVQQQRKMPFYIADYTSPTYQNRKRLFAMETFYEHGFLDHLSGLKGAQTVILFGSFSRWDWHKESDIDIFIYGSDKEFEQGKFEKLLHREIQVFTCTGQTLAKLNNKLLLNILKGDIIKGDVDFLRVVHA